MASTAAPTTSSRSPPRNGKPRKLHPCDERIGADASIVRTEGGKKQFLEQLTGMKFHSQITIPLGASFIGDLPNPAPHDPREAHFDPKHHMWRAYRIMMQPAGSERTQGKKMYARGESSTIMEEKIRHSLREKIRAHREREVRLREELLQQRERLGETHHKRDELIDSTFRRRCRERGLEGLVKPSLKSPEPVVVDASVSDEMLLKLAVYARRDGKKTVPRAEAAAGDKLPPFGPPLCSTSPSRMARWGTLKVMD